MTTLHRVAALFAVVAVLPNVAVAQPFDPSGIGDTSALVRAVASFALVAAAGGAVLLRAEPRVHQALDALIDRPYRAVPYGLVAYVIVVVVGAYGISLLGRIGIVSTVVGRAAMFLLAAAVVFVTGFGFLVVGTTITDLEGRRRPWYGLLVGAVLSAVCWAFLPLLGGLIASAVVAALGIGGSTRRWLQAERTVASERAE